MNSSGQMEGANIRGQSQSDQPPIDIELEDEMADSMYLQFTMFYQFYTFYFCITFVFFTSMSIV